LDVRKADANHTSRFFLSYSAKRENAILEAYAAPSAMRTVNQFLTNRAFYGVRNVKRDALRVDSDL